MNNRWSSPGSKESMCWASTVLVLGTGPLVEGIEESPLLEDCLLDLEELAGRPAPRCVKRGWH